MKSAYELAMERLEKDDPNGVQSLSDEQREALANLDQKYQAKIAEREVFLNGKIVEARIQEDAQAFEQLETQLRNERLRLEEEMESEKDKVRNQG